MQAGQVIAVRVKGARPDGSAHKLGAVAMFFAPGKDPQHDPAARETPDRVLALPFDPASRTYGRDVATAGWQPGTWTVQGAVLGPDGQPEGWSWSAVPLDP